METIFFETLNNKKIFCYLSEVKDSKKMIIMNHGFRGSSTGPARMFVDFQRVLNENGYSVLRFDQPNSANSDGDFLESSFNEWIDTTTYFAEKYIERGYKVALLGQSMGGTTTMAAALRKELKNKIPCVILWVPGTNDGDVSDDPNKIFEELGQKYRAKFWTEARNSDFFKCLKEYEGGIHLTYGETDRYVPETNRNQAIQIVKEKGFDADILKGQDHSPWEIDVAQEVYKKEIEFLKKYF